MLTDFLTARSRFQRRVVQVDQRSRKLMDVFGFLSGSPQEKGVCLQSDSSQLCNMRIGRYLCCISCHLVIECWRSYSDRACVFPLLSPSEMWLDPIRASRNVALDLFHVDKAVPPVKCPRCKITHPKVDYPGVQDESKQVRVADRALNVV